MAARKVVVTGTGMVTAVGLDTKSSWQALKAGTGGIATLTGFGLEGLKSTFAGQVVDFDPTSCMEPKEARKADRFVQLAMAASVEAMEQAGSESFDDYLARYFAGQI